MGKRKLLTELTRNDLKKIDEHIKYLEGIFSEELKDIVMSVIVTHNSNDGEDYFYVVVERNSLIVTTLDGRDVNEVIGKIDGFIAGLSLK